METKSRAAVGVVVRFKNSASTLPAVLKGLQSQNLQPELILGINNQSTDGSCELVRKMGGCVIDWKDPYNHARVLNFALRRCPTPLVLILSSHTILRSPDALQTMVEAMSDPACACVSGKWDDDPFYSDAVTRDELRAKGMKMASIYSNSFGLLRRSFWEELPFDESLPTMEDYAWALEQVERGRICRRVSFSFEYLRSGSQRHGVFAHLAFRLAARHHLRLVWLGPRESMKRWCSCVARLGFSREPKELLRAELRLHSERLGAWLTWRWRKAPQEP